MQGSTSIAPSPVESRQILGLDLVRFFAALCVVAFHLGYAAWASWIGTTQNAFGHVASLSAIAPFTWFGWVGVEIFFVISGFVIAYSAYGSTPYKFFVSRATRLMPAAWICCAMTLAVVLAGHLLTPREALISALRAALFYPFGPWIDGAYWTLGIEIGFYGIVFLLLLVGRFKALERVMVGFGTVSLVFWGLTFLPSLVWMGDLPQHRSFQMLLVPHAPFFALGVVLWAAMRQGLTLARAGSMALMLLAGGLEIVQTANDGQNHSAVIPLAVFLLGFVAIVLSIVLNDRFIALAGGRAGAIRTIGLTTYPLYLIHNVVGAFTERELIVFGVHKYLALPLTVLAMLVVAWSIARFLEPPLKQQLRSVMIRAGRRMQLA